MEVVEDDHDANQSVTIVGLAGTIFQLWWLLGWIWAQYFIIQKPLLSFRQHSDRVHASKSWGYGFESRRDKDFFLYLLLYL